jgi:hypothetical protein
MHTYSTCASEALGRNDKHSRLHGHGTLGSSRCDLSSVSLFSACLCVCLSLSWLHVGHVCTASGISRTQRCLYTGIVRCCGHGPPVLRSRPSCVAVTALLCCGHGPPVLRSRLSCFGHGLAALRLGVHEIHPVKTLFLGLIRTCTLMHERVCLPSDVTCVRSQDWVCAQPLQLCTACCETVSACRLSFAGRSVCKCQKTVYIV